MYIDMKLKKKEKEKRMSAKRTADQRENECKGS